MSDQMNAYLVKDENRVGLADVDTIKYYLIDTTCIADQFIESVVRTNEAVKKAWSRENFRLTKIVAGRYCVRVTTPKLDAIVDISKVTYSDGMTIWVAESNHPRIENAHFDTLKDAREWYRWMDIPKLRDTLA